MVYIFMEKVLISGGSALATRYYLRDLDVPDIIRNIVGFGLWGKYFFQACQKINVYKSWIFWARDGEKFDSD